MSKLFKLKKWLTVPETAEHFSKVLEEEVNEADIIRLALDGELAISVYFVNHVHVKRGRLQYLDEETIAERIKNDDLPEGLKWAKLPDSLSPLDQDQNAQELTDAILCILNYQLWPGYFLILEDDVTVISGVHDLPVVGSNALDLEHFYQQLIGGPSVTLESLEGDSIVGDTKGELFQIQESFDNNPYQPGSLAQRRDLERQVVERGLDEHEADLIFAEHNEKREAYLEKRRNQPRALDYFPAGGLPEDSIFVVRTQAITNFLSVLSTESEDLPEAVPRAGAQEAVILQFLRDEGFDPQAIPVTRGGRGAKSVVRQKALNKRRDLFTDSAFSKAWQRLRDNDQIQDA